MNSIQRADRVFEVADFPNQSILIIIPMCTHKQRYRQLITLFHINTQAHLKIVLLHLSYESAVPSRLAYRASNSSIKTRSRVRALIRRLVIDFPEREGCVLLRVRSLLVNTQHWQMPPFVQLT
jgi:hypothetical protein